MRSKFLTLLNYCVLGVGVVLSSSALLPAFAQQALQLNITGGSYLGSDESGTNVNNLGATINPFILNAYCRQRTTGQQNRCNTATNKHTYSLVISLLERDFDPLSAVPSDIGSFTVERIAPTGGSPFTFTFDSNDFTWSSTPPLNLAPHGVFPTAYTVLNIGSFSNTARTTNVDTENTPGFDPSANSGTALFYQSFKFDITELNSQYRLHFDLVNNNNTRVNASFSHDAVTTPGLDDDGGGSTEIPEPSTIVGLAFFLGGLILTRKGKSFV